MKTITISCEAAATIDYRKITPLQGDLKSMTKAAYKRLRASILKRGFTKPIDLWKNGGKNYDLDGHQRCLVLAELEREGFKIPPVPVVWVKAKNLKEAKEILLSNVSQYAKVENQELYEFMHDAEIPFTQLAQEFEIPGINAEHFMAEFVDEIKIDEKPKKKIKVSVTCPKCKHEFKL